MSRSRRALASVVALAALGVSACVEPDPPHAEDEGWADAVPPVAELGIDTGAGVELAPGQGVGVAVEYAGEGRWSVTAGCDTALTGLGCTFDLLVSTDDLSPITEFSAEALDDGDRLVALDGFAVSGEFRTHEGTDGFGFTTSPGATVRVSALLYDLQSGWGWSEDPRIISWVGNGAVHRGAPTNPVDLTPDRP